MKTSIWCEFLKPQELMGQEILNVLKKYNTSLYYKVEYREFDDELFKFLSLLNSKEIKVYIWATLPDQLGYWINENNTTQCLEYIKDIIKIVKERRVSIQGIILDMEPPLKDIMAITNPKHFFEPTLTYGKMMTINMNKKRYRKSVSHMKKIKELGYQWGIEIFPTALRHNYYDTLLGSNIVQNALETPLFDVGWSKYNFMYYATMIRHELRHRNPEEVDYFIYNQVSKLKVNLKSKVSISAGVTNVGKLGNEPYYNDIGEFKKDIGILKAAGVEDIALFSLDGLAKDGRLEVFLEAIIEAEPLHPLESQWVLKRENEIIKLLKIGKVMYNCKTQ